MIEYLLFRKKEGKTIQSRLCKAFSNQNALMLNSPIRNSGYSTKMYQSFISAASKCKESFTGPGS